MITGVKKRCEEFIGNENGTYDIQTGLTVEYKSGFQFSFVRPEAYSLSDENWDCLTEFVCENTGSKPYIGVYAGDAEVSFRVDTLDEAMKYVYMFNQECVMDWKAKSEGKKSEMFINNDKYDKRREIDYVEIIKKVQRNREQIFE